MPFVHEGNIDKNPKATSRNIELCLDAWVVFMTKRTLFILRQRNTFSHTNY